MYKITDSTQRAAVYAALSSRTREFKQRVSFGWWDTTGDRREFVVSTSSNGTRMVYERGIINLNVSQQGNGESSGLVMGCCCASSCEVEFYNLDTVFNYNTKVVFVECGIKLEDDSFYYIPAGFFIAEQPESEDDWRTVKITAYDEVSLMSGKWKSSLQYPNNAKAVLEEICGSYSIPLEYGEDIETALSNRIITESDALKLTSYSQREVCGFIAGLVGANARMNTIGSMRIDWYAEQPSDYSVSIPAEIQWQNGFKKISEDMFVINSITSGVDDAVFTAGTGTGISFVNPIITEMEITAIYEKYGGLGFQPCSCEWRGNPCVECGDIIAVTDRKGAGYTVLISEQDIDLTGGLSSLISCPGGDADISFDTVNERTRAALNRQKTDWQNAITEATNALKGAEGGFFEILDNDSDGNPDGWMIKENEDGSKGVILANKAGIGLSTDGGTTYRTAITYDGINADCINAGKIKSELIEADSITSKHIAADAVTSKHIAANSITADKLTVGDFTNYCTLNENTASEFNFKSAETYANESAHSPYITKHWLTPITYPTASPYEIPISKSHPCKEGDVFRTTGKIYSRAYHGSPVTVTMFIRATLEDGSTKDFEIITANLSVNNSGSSTLGGTSINVTTTITNLSNPPVSFQTYLKTSNSVTAGWFAVNDIEVRRCSAGEITAGRLKSAATDSSGTPLFYFDLDTGHIFASDATLSGVFKSTSSQDGSYVELSGQELTDLEDENSHLAGLRFYSNTNKLYSSIDGLYAIDDESNFEMGMLGMGVFLDSDCSAGITVSCISLDGTKDTEVKVDGTLVGGLDGLNIGACNSITMLNNQYIKGETSDGGTSSLLALSGANNTILGLNSQPGNTNIYTKQGGRINFCVGTTIIGYIDSSGYHGKTSTT